MLLSRAPGIRRLPLPARILVGLSPLLALLGLTRIERHRLEKPLPGPSAAVAPASRLDHDRLWRDLRTLGDDGMEGRRTGSPGSHAAEAYIVRRLTAAGVEPLAPGYRQAFRFTFRRRPLRRPWTVVERHFPDASNLVGRIRGASDDVIVLTAHRDHLGVRDGEIYNGADDNASGVATLLAVAADVARRPLHHTLVVAALDAEEQGIFGARHFVAYPPVPLARVRLAVNLDMLARPDEGRVVVAGTWHTPELAQPVAAVARRHPLRLVLGHDRPLWRAGLVENWTHASDHGAFHDAGLPFLYFGVPDHPDYHEPTDDPERIDPVRFAAAAELVADAVRELDAWLAAGSSE